MAVVPGSPLSARSSHDVDTQGHMRASELLVTDGGSTVEPIGRALYGSAVGYETARMKHRTMTRAASCGDTAAVREFLFAGTNVNTKDEFGWNALSRYASCASEVKSRALRRGVSHSVCECAGRPSRDT